MFFDPEASKVGTRPMTPTPLASRSVIVTVLAADLSATIRPDPVIDDYAASGGHQVQSRTQKPG